MNDKLNAFIGVYMGFGGSAHCSKQHIEIQWSMIKQRMQYQFTVVSLTWNDSFNKNKNEMKLHSIFIFINTFVAAPKGSLSV